MMKLETCQELLELTDVRTVVSAVAMRSINSVTSPTVRDLEGKTSFTDKVKHEYLSVLGDGMLPADEAMLVMLACIDYEISKWGTQAPCPTLVDCLADAGYQFPDAPATAGPGR